jgi:hypothetical protein
MARDRKFIVYAWTELMKILKAMVNFGGRSFSSRSQMMEPMFNSVTVLV